VGSEGIQGAPAATTASVASTSHNPVWTSQWLHEATTDIFIYTRNAFRHCCCHKLFTDASAAVAKASARSIWSEHRFPETRTHSSCYSKPPCRFFREPPIYAKSSRACWASRTTATGNRAIGIVACGAFAQSRNTTSHASDLGYTFSSDFGASWASWL
jgi:hypothetical protein